MSKESRVKDGNYIVIQSFMIKDLNLKNNELLVYAIIYGFSQDGENKFKGSLQYLADWTNSSKASVQNNLKSLVDKGYIEKEEQYINNIKFVAYYANNLYTMQKSCIPYKKVNGGIQESCIGGIQESCTNNIYLNNIDDNILYNSNSNKEIKETIIINNNSKEKQESFSENTTKTKSKRFTKLTLEEVEQYCSERKNSIDAQTFIDYYESKGWLVGKTPMKDWKAAIRNWERRKDNNNTTNNKSTYVSPYTYNEEF